ncbi:hypothetical protein L6258_01700 [Candidatus Parcubacteria bacterium]|nr:hypothetical protein [Candidatus Parcubacteria bacterium]
MTCSVCDCTFDAEGNTKLVDDPARPPNRRALRARPAHEGEKIEVVVCPECHTETSV